MASLKSSPEGVALAKTAKRSGLCCVYGCARQGYLQAARQGKDGACGQFVRRMWVNPISTSLVSA